MVNNNDDHRVPQWLSHVVVLAQVVFGTWHYVWVVADITAAAGDDDRRSFNSFVGHWLVLCCELGTPAGEVREEDPVLWTLLSAPPAIMEDMEMLKRLRTQCTLCTLCVHHKVSVKNRPGCKWPCLKHLEKCLAPVWRLPKKTAWFPLFYIIFGAALPFFGSEKATASWNGSLPGTLKGILSIHISSNCRWPNPLSGITGTQANKLKSAGSARPTVW